MLNREQPGELELHSIMAQSSVQGCHSTGSTRIPAALHVRRWHSSHTEKEEGTMWEFFQVCGHWEEGISLMNFSALMILVKPKPHASGTHSTN